MQYFIEIPRLERASNDWDDQRQWTVAEKCQVQRFAIYFINCTCFQICITRKYTIFFVRQCFNLLTENISVQLKFLYLSLLKLFHQKFQRFFLFFFQNIFQAANQSMRHQM